MISVADLDALQANCPAREALVDIQDVHIDTTLPIAERVQDYIAKIKNPYHFLHGGSAVHIAFAPDGADLKSRLRSYFISCKQS